VVTKTEGIAEVRISIFSIIPNIDRIAAVIMAKLLTCNNTIITGLIIAE
jgi:hypothetical protein